MIEIAEENEWDFLNGNSGGEEGEFTYIEARENLVIDYTEYTMTNPEVRSKTTNLL